MWEDRSRDTTEVVYPVCDSDPKIITVIGRP